MVITSWDELMGDAECHKKLDRKIQQDITNVVYLNGTIVVTYLNDIYHAKMARIRRRVQLNTGPSKRKKDS